MVIQKKYNFFFYIAFTLFMLGKCLERINFFHYNRISQLMIIISCCVFLLNICFCVPKIPMRSLFLFGILIFIIFVDSIPSGMHELCYFLLLLWSMQYTDIFKVIKYQYFFIAVFTCCILCLVALGLVENNIVIQGDRIRSDLGFSSWTILPFQYMALANGYVFLRKEKISIIELSIIAIIGYWIYKMTDVKTFWGLLIVFLVSAYILKFVHVKRWKKLKMLRMVPWFLASLSIVSVFLFMNGNTIVQQIDQAINFRLTYAARAIDQYGIHFLSNYVEWNNGITGDYLIVDNAYINVLLNWGILGLFLILLLYMYVINWSLVQKDKYILLIIMMYLGIGLLWSRLITFVEVEFLLLFAHFFKKKQHSLSWENK